MVFRNDASLHRSLMAAILLSIASIGVSQIPLAETPPIPCVPGHFDCGRSATQIVLYWDDFPLYWLAEGGLSLLVIGMVGELKRVARQNAQAEEEINLAS